MNHGYIIEHQNPIKVKKLNENAKIPVRGSDYSAGYDLRACIEKPITIPAHSTVKIRTGLSFELPNGTFAAIFARSGLATKEGLAPANKVGVCDSDYRGEYIVPLHNNSDEAKLIMPHQRIVQMVLLPFIPMDFEEVDELNETVRGDGGFGSTGNK